MKPSELSNDDLRQVYEALKEYFDFLDTEKNKVEGLTNERRNPEPHK